MARLRDQAGEDSRNVPRFAALLAGLPESVESPGDGDLFVAGGVESMMRAPLVIAKPGVRKLLERGVAVGELDLVELNEGFASQSLAVVRELRLDEAKVNGGVIAIGHPLGMSGARLVTTLPHELRRRGGRYGLATLCIGVGQGQAALFERPGGA